MVVACALSLAAAIGCAEHGVLATRQDAARAAPQDPDRWDRAACLRGELPPEVDAKALAHAHLEDLRATRNGEAGASAAVRIQGEREAFEVRCARWRAEAAAQAGSAAGAPDARAAP